jgi:competence protein ComEC
VAKLEYQKVSFLFTGDIEEKAQKELINSIGRQLSSLVLKVPHHGGKALLADFLKKVDPQIAVISVGIKNKYGHPDQKTLELLGQIKVLRTDQNGTIRIISDGQKYWIK